MDVRVQLILLGMSLAAVSGVPALFLPLRSSLGQAVAVVLVGLGSVLGLSSAWMFWSAGEVAQWRCPWAVPGGEFHIRIDGLSAVFLVPVFLIPLLGSLYGLQYWPQRAHPANARRLQLFYGLLPAGMALVVTASNGLLLLVGWEVMALAAFFLVATEDHDSEVRQAGWVYLVATHTGTLCLFALFGLLGAVSGSLTLTPLAPGQVSPGMATALFALALVGFGFKAGLMPLHVWLPSAHANAPSHVSAVLSGVMIKMGIYGIVRVTALLPAPPLEWGAVVLGVGVVSGVLGVAYALGQHDLKRLLAYHSIENIGIIVMGVGLALLGRSLGRADWVVLGMAGALLHVWNHALFKALLFLSAGSVIHATHTREIDRLGGLARAMPWTANCFLLGAVAISGLPPLNGFVSELLVYLGLFRTLGIGEGAFYPGAALAAPALALIGALALACFVKVYGAVFLGVARSEPPPPGPLPEAERGSEAGPAMIVPMLVLAACCLVIGLAPWCIAPALGLAIEAWMPEVQGATAQLRALAPLESVGWMGLALLAGVVVVAALYRALLRRSPVTQGPTWGCGYAAPSPRMQYSASSFAELLVALFAWALRPRQHRPRHMPLFPASDSFHSEVPDAVLDRVVLPGLGLGAWLCSHLRVFQQGKIQLYLLYIFVILVTLLLWR